MTIWTCHKYFGKEKKSEKFSPSFLCFGKVQFCLSLINDIVKVSTVMSMIIHSINLILFVVETFLRVALNCLKIRIGELIPSVTNVFNSTMDVQIEVVSGIELDLDYIDAGAGVSISK